MQFKIILFLLAFIFAIIGVFGLKEIKELKASKKALETQINAINEQNEKNKLDLEARNQEITNNNVKINELQNKIKNQFKKDSCVNTIVDNDFLELLHENN